MANPSKTLAKILLAANPTIGRLQGAQGFRGSTLPSQGVRSDSDVMSEFPERLGANFRPTPARRAHDITMQLADGKTMTVDLAPGAAAATLENPKPTTSMDGDSRAITEENPLRVLIAGGGVGGLALANDLIKDPRMHVTVLEKTGKFKGSGGPIQLASNALQVLKEMDAVVYDRIMDKFTVTGDKVNGIKDGIRDTWYAKFDLATPAEARNMPYTGVIERPDLQSIYVNALPEGVLQNGDGVTSYAIDPNGHGVYAVLQSGEVVAGDVLIGSDGIWSQVRATMRDEPVRGDESGVTYSGYTLFAGELTYNSKDNGEVGYKVYIGPNQYFVITDIGDGRYQWYAFLGRDPGFDFAEVEPKPDGQVAYLRDLFFGWSEDIHHILKATQEDEIEQRDLYDRPPSVFKPWTKGSIALLGDAVHAMMPNLGQGGGQAIEDAYVLGQELKSAKTRNEIDGKLQEYRARRLIRSAAVQGLSRFASDIIIKGFDTPAGVSFKGGLKLENCNYAGIVTKLLQPILPLFFIVQFNFLYDGWKNDGNDYKTGAALVLLGSLLLVAFFAVAGVPAEAGLAAGFGLESLFGAEGFDALLASISDLF
jgi:zeaxanthin epoxidase